MHRPRPHTRPGVAVVLGLALVLTPLTAATARADDEPTAQPTPSAPVKVDADDADLQLPEGATLAPPKVLDIVSVTDASSSENASAGDGEERHEESNSSVTYALQSDVLFGKDSAKLNAAATARLKAIAADIEAKGVTQPIRVFGFTDDLGSYEHGKVLSKKRADAVYKILAEELGSLGSSGHSFQVRGYSEDYPIADNSTEAGRKQNRRVEITFRPSS
ncbi:OmpA family protein [Actinacidiphila glaucinigra]|uniref:OmpA family protein n=1 Tax=Actinacidiphila glaucinigra TaxID=235986 RepID=A0A239F3Q7_9ACTN|nr:OmpA family protein [Actinacidiphila glaucinigra]SNS51519.1 OmpA family protein [Actinacidiphila glaucinigra]